MPILFEFERRQLLLWLVEFQEDKSKFSIYKVLRYATDMAEAHPQALVVPVVLFTDRKRWRKNVKRQLDFRMGRRVFLCFEFLFVKLSDYDVRDCFHSKNQLVKILALDQNPGQKGRSQGSPLRRNPAISAGANLVFAPKWPKE